MNSPAPAAATRDATTIAIESIRANAAALDALAARLDGSMAAAVALIGAGSGRVVVSGIGKSGLIARKIAATMSSLGTPSLFVHSTEAMHGDLGQVGRGDVAILISGSGETREVVQLVPFLKRGGNAIIAITANMDSSLARHADVVLDGTVERESCALNLAPTTSTLVALALGDALAIAAAEARGFRASDFAMFHPGGKLGERLLTPVGELMRRDDLPLVGPDVTLRDVAPVMSAGGIGMALVMRGDRLAGVLTDGDLRRAMAADDDIDSVTAGERLTSAPRTVRPDVAMFDAEMQMRAARITALVVTDDAGVVLGVVQIHD